jgi:hypothetical protein
MYIKMRESKSQKSLNNPSILKRLISKSEKGQWGHDDKHENTIIYGSMLSRTGWVLITLQKAFYYHQSIHLLSRPISSTACSSIAWVFWVLRSLMDENPQWPNVINPSTHAVTHIYHNSCFFSNGRTTEKWPCSRVAYTGGTHHSELKCFISIESHTSSHWVDMSKWRWCCCSLLIIDYKATHLEWRTPGELITVNW